jgi:DNA-binding transcriptional MocR family regulator
MKLYEQFAEEIAELIRTGALNPGEKIPSVRTASRTHEISPATVFQAYYLLERRGLIEARARSGYIVRANAKGVLAEPQFADLAHPHEETAATDVDVSELVFSVLDSIKDPETIPLGSAFPSPDLFPLQRLARSMTKSLREMPAHAVVADMTAGNANLRRQITLRAMAIGNKFPADELVITNGALEALNLCLQTVTNPGDLVAIESPAFYAKLQVLERLKLKAVEIPVHPRDGIDLDILADSLARLPIKACWVMSSFQNPLGASMSDEKKQKLCELIAQYQLPTIEDDVYAELYFGIHQPKPLKSFDQQHLVMYCSSFSKSLAPGYRVGWVAGGKFSEQINRLQLMTTISSSVPAQAAIADYLQHGGFDRHLRKLREALESQQQKMLAAIERHFPQGTRVTQPKGGYFLWVELPPEVDSLQLFKLALAQGISIAPGPIFSASQRFRNCIRINYGNVWNAKIEDAVSVLGKLIASFS